MVKVGFIEIADAPLEAASVPFPRSTAEALRRTAAGQGLPYMFPIGTEAYTFGMVGGACSLKRNAEHYVLQNQNAIITIYIYIYLTYE